MMFQVTYFSSRNISTAFSLAALRTPVIVPPARPAEYAKCIDGYFTLSGALNVNDPNLNQKSFIGIIVKDNGFSASLEKEN
jgi:hypothetical protein